MQELHKILNQGPDLEKNSFARKSECNKEKSMPQAKNILGFVKCFTEFAKGIYEICDRNFFNLTVVIVVVVFSIVQFILFLHFASSN